MFKKCLILSFLFLAGCDNSFNKEKAIKIINLENEDKCIYVSFTAQDIRFNTSSRIYDTVTKTIMISTILDSFSISEGNIDPTDFKQLIALEEEGLIKKVADHVNLTIDGKYVTDVESSNISPFIETKKGAQYQLTKLGRSYFSSVMGDSLPKVCIGYAKVDNLIINDVIEEEGKYNVSYNIKITDRPNWLKSPNVQEAIPSLEEAIAKLEQNNITTDIIKENNNYKIKNN